MALHYYINILNVIKLITFILELMIDSLFVIHYFIIINQYAISSLHSLLHSVIIRV